MSYDNYDNKLTKVINMAMVASKSAILLQIILPGVFDNLSYNIKYHSSLYFISSLCELII